MSQLLAPTGSNGLKEPVTATTKQGNRLVHKANVRTDKSMYSCTQRSKNDLSELFRCMTLQHAHWVHNINDEDAIKLLNARATFLMHYRDCTPEMSKQRREFIHELGRPIKSTEHSLRGRCYNVVFKKHSKQMGLKEKARRTALKSRKGRRS